MMRIRFKTLEELETTISTFSGSHTIDKFLGWFGGLRECISLPGSFIDDKVAEGKIRFTPHNDTQRNGYPIQIRRGAGNHYYIHRDALIEVEFDEVTLFSDQDISRVKLLLKEIDYE